jgi:hypothetical protein
MNSVDKLKEIAEKRTKLYKQINELDDKEDQIRKKQYEPDAAIVKKAEKIAHEIRELIKVEKIKCYLPKYDLYFYAYVCIMGSDLAGLLHKGRRDSYKAICIEEVQAIRTNFTALEKATFDDDYIYDLADLRQLPEFKDKMKKSIDKLTELANILKDFPEYFDDLVDDIRYF